MPNNNNIEPSYREIFSGRKFTPREDNPAGVLIFEWLQYTHKLIRFKQLAMLTITLKCASSLFHGCKMWPNLY